MSIKPVVEETVAYTSLTGESQDGRDLESGTDAKAVEGVACFPCLAQSAFF